MCVKECPQCGAPIDTNKRECDYCKAKLYVSSISYLSSYDVAGIQKYLKYYKELSSENNIDGYLGLGICYLQLNMYSLALKSFTTVIEKSPEISQAYYYYCLSLIAGQKVSTLSFDTIEKVVSYLNTAMILDPTNNLYPLLLMIINYDFYISNCMLEPNPTYSDLKRIVNIKDIDINEIDRLKKSVKVEDWENFNLK